MQFGIMDMQIGALVPSGTADMQSAIAHINNFDHAGLARGLAEQGFNPIELGGDLMLFFPGSYSPAAVQKLAELKAEKGLRYTMHLPLWSVEPSSPFTPVRQGSAQGLIDAIQLARSLEPEAFVLHATGALAAEFYQMRLPPEGKQLILRQFQMNAGQTIQRILSETGIAPRKLAIETVEFPFELTLELAENFNTSICLDTGHVLVGFSGPVDLFDVVEKVLPRLGEIHLHDGPWQGPERKIGYGKDHSPLGTGDLDVGHLLDHLNAANYTGPIIFELTIEQAKASLEYIRKIRPQYL